MTAVDHDRARIERMARLGGVRSVIPIEPNEIEETGDDSPTKTIWGYVWRMSGWRQVGLCGLALAATLVHLVPIELQRRLIDDAITPGEADLLITLGAFYAAALLGHQVLKMGLQLGQAWLSESTIFYTRGHLLGLYRAGRAGSRERPGEAVSILNAEVEKLGGFVGQGPSSAFSNLSMLLGVTAYMLYVDPKVAGLSLLLIVPQVLVTPLMQRKLNALIETRLRILREFGDAISGDGGQAELDRRLCEIYGNRMWFHIWKVAMKALLNLLNAAAPLAMLLVGGWFVIQGETTVGVLVAFLTGFQRLSEPLRQLITFYRECAQAGVQHGMIARWM